MHTHMNGCGAQMFSTQRGSGGVIVQYAAKVKEPGGSEPNFIGSDVDGNTVKQPHSAGSESITDRSIDQRKLS